MRPSPSPGSAHRATPSRGAVLSAPTRRRAMLALFGGAALAATSYIPAVSVAPLVAEDILGSPRWSGLPGAVTVAGMALGATLLTGVMTRRTRASGLRLGFAVATAAATLAALAVGLASFPLFLAAMAVFGGGLGARHLARYAAGDLYAAGARGTAISMVVWAGTVGSILGPLLLAPARDAATRLGAPGLVGPYLLALLATALAWLVLVAVLPELPASVASRDSQEASWGRTRLPLAALVRQPPTLFALVALMVGQFVMVLIMAMTPIHIRSAGEGLGTVGLVFSAHTLGMFALSPLTGRLSDRRGRVQVILVGEAMLLAAALLAAPSHGDHRWTLVGALFLLGLGWNFGFVAGSALLTESVPAGERLRVQGAADTIVWSTAALANLCSGVLLAAAGYAALNLVGAALVLLPPLVALRARHALT